MRALRINGQEIPVHASLDADQDIDDEVAEAELRMADNSLRKQTFGSPKLSVRIRCRGSIPVGIRSLDYSQPVTLSLTQHEAVDIVAPNLSADLPAARRSDSGSTPYARAMVGESWVPTAVSVVGNTATVTAVTGATLYQVVYFPELLAFARRPTRGLRNGDGFDWTMTAREI